MYYIAMGAASYFKQCTSQLLYALYAFISTFIIAHFQYLYSTLCYGIVLRMMRIE